VAFEMAVLEFLNWRAGEQGEFLMQVEFLARLHSGFNWTAAAAKPTIQQTNAASIRLLHSVPKLGIKCWDGAVEAQGIFGAPFACYLWVS
jgi:hypothetical protein